MAWTPYKVTVNAGTTYQEITYRPNGSVTTGSVNNWVGSKLWYDGERQQTSSNTPGYHGQRSRKYLPEHSYHHHQWFWEYPKASGEVRFEYTDRTVVTTYKGPLGAFGNDSNYVTTVYPGDDPSNLAIQRLQSQMSLSSGNATVSLAEAHKTAAMVKQSATKIVKMVLALKAGRLGDFMKTAGLATNVSEVRAFRNRWRRQRQHGSDMRQFAANSWLEYSYGWKPLLKDVYDQAENLSRYLLANDNVISKAKSSARSERAYVEQITPTGVWQHRKVVTVKRTVRYIVRYAIPSGANTAANVFGLQNPALVAWELVPFSFVADWFLPIGNFLEGLTAYNGLVFHSGTKSERKEIHVVCETKPGPPQSGNPRITALGPVGTSKNDIILKDRVVLTAFPSQGFPQFKDPRSFAHAASAIALLQSTFIGSRNGSYKFR